MDTVDILKYSFLFENERLITELFVLSAYARVSVPLGFLAAISPIPLTAHPHPSVMRECQLYCEPLEPLHFSSKSQA